MKKLSYDQFKKYIVIVLSILTGFIHIGQFTFMPMESIKFYSWHLVLGLILVFLYKPFSKKNPKKFLVIDWICIILTAVSGFYVIANYDTYVVIMQTGRLTTGLYVFGVIITVLTIEATRRCLGWILPIIAMATMVYALFGSNLPGILGHRGYDFQRVVSTVFSDQGVLGTAIGVSASNVFLFLLFAAFLSVSGADKIFQDISIALTGKRRGGPAKMAVVASCLFGSISGSAVANVSSTGVLTIPMMKKVGYRPHVAGAIEAAASTGGQIMPPIMGAVAFLMAEFTQIPYLTIVTVATGPIILYYITLMAFIHFEAKKHNIGQMKDHHIPSARTVCSEGWHFFVAIMVIIVIMAFGYSPGMSALGGIITLIVIHSIKSRKVDFKMLYEAMVLGGRYSLGIGSLVGCIGIILSLVGLTGVGLKLSWLFTTLANGSPLVAILLVGLISMILGMGLASGPAYIVTAIAVGPALADMGFPLMTAHFIMMWFSIDSEITPPVGLASIVGAGIANADPMKTMFTAFKYAKALYILPILFYYRPALLLQSSLFDIALTFVTVMLGLIAFAAVWENYLMRRTTLLERILLLGGALLLFIPGHIWDFAGIGLFIIVYCLQRYYCPAGFRQTA